MKNLSLFILLSIPLQSFANEECIDNYRKSFFTKQSRYDKANERYKNQVRRWRDRNLAFASLGAELTNDPFPTSPKRADYKIFEEEIIQSYEFNLPQNIGKKPKLLESIYLKASLIDPDVSYQSVQDEIKKGMESSEFCTKKLFIFSSISKSNKIEDYVIASLKKKYSLEDESLKVNDSSVSKNEFSNNSQSQGSNSESPSSVNDE